jgi:hypothetical protein
LKFFCSYSNGAVHRGLQEMVHHHEIKAGRIDQTVPLPAATRAPLASSGLKVNPRGASELAPSGVVPKVAGPS